MVGSTLPSVRLTLGFHNHSPIDISRQIILCCGGCPVHCRVFSSIPGFCPLVTSRTFKLWWPRMFPDIAKCPLRGKTLLVEILCSEWWSSGRVRLRHSFPLRIRSCQLWVKGFSHSQPCFPHVYSQEIRLDTPIKLLNLFLSHTQRHIPHHYTHTFQT